MDKIRRRRKLVVVVDTRTKGSFLLAVIEVLTFKVTSLEKDENRKVTDRVHFNLDKGVNELRSITEFALLTRIDYIMDGKKIPRAAPGNLC